MQPGLGAIAHTTQFAQPGWQYLDSSCGLLPDGGSYVSLRSPDGKDWSLIIETLDAQHPTTLSMTVSGGLSAERINGWRTTERSLFEQLATIIPAKGGFNLTFEPNAIYSLTGTSGQQKGVVSRPVPPPKEFPLPYADDFERTNVGRSPPVSE